MEVYRAWADNSNNISHLSISYLKCLITLILTGEVISDPNYPYSFWVELNRAWADDLNDVSHITLEYESPIRYLKSCWWWCGVEEWLYSVSSLYLSEIKRDREIDRFPIISSVTQGPEGNNVNFFKIVLRHSCVWTNWNNKVFFFALIDQKWILENLTS